jgi:hypothetical protein
MIKSREISDAESCFSKALSDEMMFVLLARDRVAPITVYFWCVLRCLLFKNTWNDEQLKEARRSVRAMRYQNRAHKKVLTHRALKQCLEIWQTRASELLEIGDEEGAVHAGYQVTYFEQLLQHEFHK